MSSEEKVIEEIKDKINLLFSKIAELRVTEVERQAFEAEKAQYKILIDDYKAHKAALEKRA
jgi:hypothetical protein